MRIKNKWKLITPGQKNLPFWLNNFSGSSSLRRISNSSVFEIYITGRDEYNRSVIGKAMWDASNPGKLINIDSNPIMSLGPLGTFFDSGTSYPCVIEVGNEVYMYFTGWMQGISIPFYNNIGLSFMQKDGFFKPKASPVIKLDDEDCFGSGSMQVIRNKEEFLMLYTSFKNWTIENNKPKHSYILKKTTSKDGIKWSNTREIVKLHKDFNFENICKPFLHEDDLFFCARNNDKDYSIFVVSNFFSNTSKPEKMNFNIDSATWDSKGQAYPTVISFNEKKFIFYSGNNYGRGGMGVAEI